MSEIKTRMNEDQISLGMMIGICQDVMKKWLLIFSVSAMCAMIAYVAADFTYKPVYKTTTTFVVSSSAANTTTYQNLNAANSLASVFGELMNSSLFRNEVMKDAGISYFDGTIQASVISETNLLTMSVSASDSRSAFLMTKGIVEHYDSLTSQVFGDIVLQVLQYPVVPVAPSNPLQIGSVVKKAFGASFVLMCAVVTLISFFSEKVRSKQEAENKLECRVLGELNHEKKNKTLKEAVKRRKKSILITNPAVSFEYAEAVDKLSGRVLRHLHQDEKVIMVTSLHENEGKSTVAVNLALSFAKRNKKTLLIDCDLRKPACALILGQNREHYSLQEVLLGKKELADALVRHRSSGLYLLLSSKGLKTATNLLNSEAMKKLLKTVAEEFDVVIVDTPPMSLAPDAEVLSDQCDASLLVVRQNEALISELNDVIAILERSKSHVLGCVLNNVYGSSHFSPAFSEGYGRYGRYGHYGKYGYYGQQNLGKTAEKRNKE